MVSFEYVNRQEEGGLGGCFYLAWIDVATPLEEDSEVSSLFTQRGMVHDSNGRKETFFVCHERFWYGPYKLVDSQIDIRQKCTIFQYLRVNFFRSVTQFGTFSCHEILRGLTHTKKKA